ncbi:LysR family transcriptional regulator [Paraglaciecola hydrolytica]|uniref:LysR family transcriptional regulator n=1 Tax=Paraglaciecola hydrolytica TaxID=1799789 RepID=UPI000A50C2DE|nr:LysR family transcriptional regulator [Paraglaciecola hydrolytica]
MDNDYTNNNKPLFPKGRLASRIGTFRQLEILMAVAETGGIVAAAERLHLSQPSVSMQMRKLAESIGLPLYEMVGRRMTLTHAGELVFAHAKEIFACTDRLEMSLNQLQGLLLGKLSIGIVSSAEYFSPHLLGPFCRRYPQIEISLEFGNRKNILQRMQQNLDDLYIFGYPPQEQDIEATSMGINHLVLIAPHSHPLAAQSSLTWQDLSNELFILREEGSGTRLATELQLAKLGHSLDKHINIASNEGIKHAVLARMGLAIVPALSLDEGNQKDVVQLPVEGFPLSDNWHVVNRKDKVFSVIAKLCRDYLLGEGKNMVDEATQYWEKNHKPKLPTR